MSDTFTSPSPEALHKFEFALYDVLSSVPVSERQALAFEIAVEVVRLQKAADEAMFLRMNDEDDYPVIAEFFGGETNAD